MKETNRVFLTAEWRKLIMANYIIDPGILQPFLPAHTELDQWQGNYYVSLVGFMFEKVKLKGLSVPFHTRFPEVNLRFYVKYKEGKDWKRGVVFISEIVPRRAIAWIANTVYKERYSVSRMRNNVLAGNNEITVGYQWKRKTWNKIEVVADSIPTSLTPGSKEEFITEHFWGYSQKTNDRTVEYHVEHPRWDIYKINDYRIDCDFEKIYGKQFGFMNDHKPVSVFMAEGSPVRIFNRVNLFSSL
jgi:uncharacterized protein YqjF (DUF2071 family)